MGDAEKIDQSGDEQIVAKLEALDDVIFSAIDGDRSALEAAEIAWQDALKTLGPEAVEESRHQYLRHARTTWSYLRNQAWKHPGQLAAVMKIVIMLIGDDLS